MALGDSSILAARCRHAHATACTRAHVHGHTHGQGLIQALSFVWGAALGGRTRNEVAPTRCTVAPGSARCAHMPGGSALLAHSGAPPMTLPGWPGLCCVRWGGAGEHLQLADGRRLEPHRCTTHAPPLHGTAQLQTKRPTTVTTTIKWGAIPSTTHPTHWLPWWGCMNYFWYCDDGVETMCALTKRSFLFMDLRV